MTDGFSVNVNYTATASEYSQLATDLARLEPALRRRVGAKLRTAGQETLDVGRRNASWSRRIPGAMSMRFTTRGRFPGVIITVDANAAPHARPFEGIVRSAFKHPLFGDRNDWYEQAARPFLRPAAKQTGARVNRLTREAIDEALAETVSR